MLYLPGSIPVIEKLPSLSVEVLKLVPSTVIIAPSKEDLPEKSVTDPFKLAALIEKENSIVIKSKKILCMLISKDNEF
jgi:hypothetical protein